MEFKKLLYPVAVLSGFIVLAFLCKMFIMFVYYFFFGDYEAYRTAIVGFSKVIAGSIIFYYLKKRNIITLKNQLKISLKLARLIIYSGVIISVIIRYIFINKTPIESDHFTFLNYFVATVIFIPVIEEFIFRNGIQELILQHTNQYVAIFLASLFYSVGHIVLFDFSLYIFMYYLLLGILLGYSLYYSGSIFVPVAISVLYNLFLYISFHISL